MTPPLSQAGAQDGASDLSSFEAETRTVLLGLKERLLAGEVEPKDIGLVINFIDAALETDEGPEDEGFALFAVRAGCGHLGDRVEKLESSNQRLRAALQASMHELQEVIEWATTERAPLREQEVASLRAAVAAARSALDPLPT